LLLFFFNAALHAAPTEAFQRLTNMGNRVRVDVKPVQLLSGKPLKFLIWLNTHFVDLNYDLVKLSELRDDTGQRYRPVEWQGTPPGGHHRRGTLVFPPLEGNPQTITLIIREVAGVPERIFTWKLAP
jgi:hypothetical protein